MGSDFPGLFGKRAGAGDKTHCCAFFANDTKTICDGVGRNTRTCTREQSDFSVCLMPRSAISSAIATWSYLMLEVRGDLDTLTENCGDFLVVRCSRDESQDSSEELRSIFRLLPINGR